MDSWSIIDDGLLSPCIRELGERSILYYESVKSDLAYLEWPFQQSVTTVYFRKHKKLYTIDH